MTKITYIPGEIANAAIDEQGNRKPVTRTQHIFDDALNKSQSQINEDTTEAISDEATRAQNAESGLNTRLQSVEELAEISVGGGDIQIANTGEDIQPGSGKVATANALADAYGYFVENPEWIYVLLDSQKRIFAGLKSDGSVEWSVGVPTPVKEYVEAQIETIMSGTESDRYDGLDKIADFLDGLHNSLGGKRVSILGDSISTFDQEGYKIDGYAMWYPHTGDRSADVVSVDDTWWKKVIDSAGAALEVNASCSGSTASTLAVGFSSRVSVLGNPDVIFVALGTNDSGRGVSIGDVDFEALTYDLTQFAPAYIKGIKDIKAAYPDAAIVCIAFDMGKDYKQAIKDIAEHYNLAYIDVGDISDVHPNKAEMNAVYERINVRYSLALKSLLDNKLDKEQDRTLILRDYAEGISCIENPEFVAAYLDSEEKILFGVHTDGNFYFGCGVPKQIIDYVKGHIDAIREELDGKVDKEEGKSLIGEGVADSLSTIEDPEGRHEITFDSEKKIISYRKDDGTKVENAGIETNHIELTEEGMHDFQKALKDAGFQPGGGGDWSDKEVVEVPHPTRYAILNFHIDKLPKDDGEVKEGYAEYYDGLGNYFKKAVKLETQGQSSRAFAKTGNRGNYTLDIDDGSEIKFGSWVPQDSFHLKGTPKDVTHGILATSYKWAYMFMEYLDAKPNRVLLKDSNNITTTNASGDRFTDWIDDARCLPDGFPVEIYVEGEYWGLYALQLKKHRKNYSIKKSDYTSLFIDADCLLDGDHQHGFWLDGVDSAPAGTTGKTWWNCFDIKGPKDLVCMDGSVFDGDNPKELIDSTSPVYDSSNKKHKGSAQTKAIIRGFSTKYLEVKALIDNNNIEGAKAKFNENFDYNACMLVYIFNCLMNNGDSINKNTLWGTWKNGKIAPMLWDIDGVYGTDWWGGTCSAPNTGLWTGIYATAGWPLSFMWTLYQDEIRATYAELRSHGIIDMNTWKSIVFGWANQIGTEAFDRDIERWPEMPSYRENYTNTEYWQQLNGSSSAYSTYPAWDENTSYSVGDIVVIKIHPSIGLYLRYRAVKASDAQNPQPPVTKLYDACPQVGGYYDSPRRMEKWMEEQIRLCDIKNYYFAELIADFIAYRNSDKGYEIECINMTVDTNLSKDYNYIQGHITRHENVVEGQTVSTYTIDGGAETPEDVSKAYTTVRAAIEAAASQPVDIPSENIYYIKSRAKDINYHKK